MTFKPLICARLKVIAEKLKISREAIYNRSNFFEDYTSLCKVKTNRELPEESRIITSDDVFDYMLNENEFES